MPNTPPRNVLEEVVIPDDEVEADADAMEVQEQTTGQDEQQPQADSQPLCKGPCFYTQGHFSDFEEKNGSINMLIDELPILGAHGFQEVAGDAGDREQ